MRNVLTSLILCLQLVTTSVAQQPAVPQPPKPAEQKPATPQDPEDVDVVKITTNLVQVDAVVTDKSGKQVTDLNADEVEILEDGKPRTITNFSYIRVRGPINVATTGPAKDSAPGAPGPPRKLRPEEVQRTIALVVDDLGLSFESAYYTRKTLRKFLDEYMQPNDLVAIVRTAGGMGALQSFTSDKGQLYAAIEKVKWSPNGRGRIAPFSPISSDGLPNRGGNDPDDVTADSEAYLDYRDKLFTVGTLAALNYVFQGLRELPGRKSVIMFSDGFTLRRGEPSETERFMRVVRELVDNAHRASVVINSLDVRGLQVLGIDASDSISLMDPQTVMARLNSRRVGFINTQEGLMYLASETGGRSIRNTNDLDGGIRRILDDQSGYYLIGYRPDDSTFDRLRGGTKFHRISLKIKRPGNYQIRTRSGFFGVSDEKIKVAEKTPEQRFISALLSPFSSSGVQLRLTSVFANDPQLGSVMQSFLHVKASDLTFTSDSDGSQKAVFDILAMTFGDNGKVVDQFAFTHTMRLKPPLFETAMKNGFTYNVTVPIKKSGAYQLRTALRDQSSGRIGSATQFINVPDFNQDRLSLSGIVMKGVPLERQTRDQLVAEPKQEVDAAAPDPHPTANISVRQFQTGMALVYTFIIYNAKIDKATGRPQLKTQAKLFRNGELIFTGDELPFDVGPQTDLRRLGTGGAIQLGTSMKAGEYVLQIVVTDLLAKDRRRVATQWMDFEILK